jgi:hypothetical protein
MKHEQLELFFLPPQPRTAVYDPAWDELEIAHQQNKRVGEQLIAADSACKSVGEQVTSDTLKFAPQHDGKLYTQLSEEKTTHWVEKYWVERGTNKYWYYRYMWMEGRKLYRVYIGSVTSNKAKLKKQAVIDAIADGESPQEIKQLIRQ